MSPDSPKIADVLCPYARRPPFALRRGGKGFGRPGVTPFLRRITLTVLFFTFCSLAVKPVLIAQNRYSLEFITQEDGLSNNNANVILQDYQGFIWLGTENGLNRFDGKNFLQYRFDPENPGSLNSSRIYSLLEDSKKNLWIGTVLGLNLLNTKSGKIKRIPLLDIEGKAITATVTGVYEDSMNNIWIASARNGLFKISSLSDDQKLQAIIFPYSDKEIVPEYPIENITFVDDRFLWISTKSGIDRLEIQTKELDRLIFTDASPVNDNDKLMAIWDGKKNIIFEGADQLYFINTSSENPQIRPFEEYLPGNFHLDGIIGFSLDGEDALLIYAKDQLFTLDLSTGNTELIIKDLDDKIMFPVVRKANFYVDRERNIWALNSVYGFGLIRRSQTPFVFYKNDPSQASSISDGPVRTFMEDGNGHLWIGIYGHGLDQFKYTPDNELEKLRSFTHIPGDNNSLPGDKVLQIIQDQDGLFWIIGNEGGLVKMDPANGRIERFKENPAIPNSAYLSNFRLWGLANDKSNRIWVGTWEDGLVRFTPETGQIKVFSAKSTAANKLVSDQIRFLLMGKDDILWIGTREGLSRLDTKTEHFTNYRHTPDDPHSLSNNYVWALYIDHNNTLWVGTDSGLNKMDPATGQFERFYENDGLPSSIIYGILEDSSNRLWVSTDEGLASIRSESSSQVFNPIDVYDGLELASFLPKAYYLNEGTGQLYFGTAKGMLVVEPELFQSQNQEQNLKVHALSTFNPKSKDARPAFDYFFSNKNAVKKLTYKDQVVHITLADMNWSMARNHQFEYLLQGFNQQWVELDKDMTITFTGLPPGKYVLRARTKSLNDVPLQPVELITLRVFPPWWASIWAYMIYVMVLGGLIVLSRFTN